MGFKQLVSTFALLLFFSATACHSPPNDGVEGDALGHFDVRPEPDDTHQSDSSTMDAPSPRVDVYHPDLDSADADNAGQDISGDTAAPRDMESIGETDDAGALPPCPSPAALVEPAVGGRVYEDGDRSAISFHAQGMQPPADRPLGGVPVELLGTGAPTTTESCPNGRFSFGAVAEGVHVLGLYPEAGRTGTSRSLTRRVPHAIKGGGLVIVTFGDSIPLEGGEPFFPEVLDGLFSALVDVDNRVVARGGSTSSEWVPGSDYFEERLAPHLAEADLIIGSIGGNDLSDFFDVSSPDIDPDELLARLADFPTFFDEVTDRIVLTLEEIRSRAPQADTVYIMYTNYARSDRWQELAGEYAGLAAFGLDNALRIMRTRIAQVEGILIADMYAATATEDLDPYLEDEIHLSAAGAVRWAREIFLLLGGVIVGSEELGLYRQYALSPVDP